MPYKNKTKKNEWRWANRAKQRAYSAKYREKYYNTDEYKIKKQLLLEKKWRANHKADILALRLVVKDLRKQILLRDGLRICHSCGKIKPFESMKKTRFLRNGTSGICKECFNQRVRSLRIPKPQKDVMRPCRRCGLLKHTSEFKRYAQGRLMTVCNNCYLSPKEALKNRYQPLRELREKLFKEDLAYCSRCKKIKNVDRFVKGLHLCKKCLAASTRKNYYSKTPEQRRADARRQWFSMIRKNPSVKLKCTLRSRFSSALRNAMVAKKESSARVMKYIGCPINFFKKYLEYQFKPGMTWDNHGIHGWHIDHVIPLSSFDLTNEQAMKKAWHYTNLQPLWAKENLRKHNKKPKSYQPNLLLVNP